ncbi:MAG: MYXO-CTERM sorting domain-containing protein [Luteolibacter sp.]|jgi:uncharacterized protein (TIGR03382 family)|nr:MYXO-CTERM sorting domain-containing protein [Luteolibacter sp.]
MKLKTLIPLCGLLAAGTSFGATGIFGSYVDIFTTTSTVYKGENFSSKANFQGASLGTFDLTDTLIITQSQIDTFKNSGGNVTGAEINYRVYLTAGSPGGYITESYNWQSDANYNDIGGVSITGSGDQAWGSTADINLNPGVAGDYTVEVFFKAFTNEGDRFSNNGGSNFKATFTVVPEPASAALGLLGTVLLLRRRRF